MVCLGNICRSPLAEGILQHKAHLAGLNWQVESAGTGGWHVGNPPHPLSQKIARLNGVDISQQKARQFAASDMQDFDKVYFMDSANYTDARHLAGPLWNEAKADLLMNELYPGQNRAVPDPYYGTEEGYHQVFAMLAKACDCIIEKYSAAPAI